MDTVLTMFWLVAEAEAAGSKQWNHRSCLQNSTGGCYGLSGYGVNDVPEKYLRKTDETAFQKPY